MTEGLKIGEVSRRTGLTVRTLRYYEEIGLLSPCYDEGSGHRRYTHAELLRLYRISLLRQLGTPLNRIADALGDRPDGLEHAVEAHLHDLDDRLAALGRLRERVSAVSEALGGPEATSAESLLEVLRGMNELDAGLVQRLTLLVYDDLEAAHDYLVSVFGFGPGRLDRNAGGEVVHGEVHVGDGVIWLHPASAEHGLASPHKLGASTHCMAVFVDDVDAHHAQVVAAGADVVFPPRDMDYGFREYDVRDCEGGLWSFMKPLRAEHDPEHE